MHLQNQIQSGKGTLLEATLCSGPLCSCRDMLAQLLTIQAAFCSLYVDMRREFPRLQLISDDEIQQALCLSSAPQMLSSSMLSAVFPGVTALVAVSQATDAVGDDVSIKTVIAADDDTLRLVDPVAVANTPLHHWLAHLNVAMRSSLRALTQACLECAASLPVRSLPISS